MMTLPDLSDSDRIALFLDFDGTLVAIADRPDEVQLDLSTRQALVHLDTLLGGANQGKGTLGKMAHDTTLYVKLNETLTALTALLNDLRERPGRYLTVKVF